MAEFHYFTFSSQYINYFLACIIWFISHLIQVFTILIGEEAMLVEIELKTGSLAPTSVSKVREVRDYTRMG